MLLLRVTAWSRDGKDALDWPIYLIYVIDNSRSKFMGTVANNNVAFLTHVRRKETFRSFFLHLSLLLFNTLLTVDNKVNNIYCGLKKHGTW